MFEYLGIRVLYWVQPLGGAREAMSVRQEREEKVLKMEEEEEERRTVVVMESSH